MADTDMLAQAIAAARRGERRRARSLLTKVLRSDQKNESAWLWMSAVVESDRERVVCLQSVLKINPENKSAESGLMLLGAVPARQRPRSILDEYEREPAGGAATGRRLTLFRRRRTYEWIALIGLSLAAVCFLAVYFVLGIGLRRQATVSAGESATAFHSPTLTATPSGTPSPVPSATPSVRTATPTFDPATPLALRVGATIGATVPYFETPHIENDSFQAGMRRFRTGDWSGVIQFMQGAIHSNPNLYEAYFFIGEAHRLSGKPNDAMASYGQAIRLNARYAPAYWGRAQAQASFGRPTAALADLERATEIDPKWPSPYLERAAIYRARGDLEQAKAELTSASLVAPGDVSVRWSLAQVLADLGQTDEALAEIEAALQIDPTIVEIYLVRGRLRLATGKYDAARADLGLYLTYRPDDPEAWYARAVADVALGDEPTALADFERALALAPRYAEALVARGEIYFALNNYDAALADFNAALAQGETARARVGRGQVYYYQGEFAKAILDFRRAAARAPGEYTPNYWLGRALVEASKGGEAVASLTLALEAAAADSDRLAVYQWRARAYQQTGNEAAEDTDLRALLALGGSVPEAAQVLTAASARLNELEAGMTATSIAASITATPSLTPTMRGTRTTATPMKKIGTETSYLPAALP